MKLLKSKPIALMVSIMAVLICGSLVVAAPQPRGFGRTIAAITVGQDRLANVRSLYGPGALATVGDVQSLCYYVEQDQAYFSVSTFEGESRVRSIALTTFTNVTPSCRNARITGKHLTASHGIALGDSIAKVLDALGQPTERGKVPIGERNVSYANYAVPGGRATCWFEHDRLILISIELD
jgi:hypothetical protein